MIAGLQERFLLKVLNGFKRHTIRRGKRWRAGMRIDLFLNVRQKNMRLIFRAPVTKVEEFHAQVRQNGMDIWIDGQRLDLTELHVLAFRDGFDSHQEMFVFWREEHGLGPFHGQIINWDFERRTFEPVRSKPRATSKARRSKRAR